MYLASKLTSVSRKGSCLGDLEVGPRRFGGWGRSGVDSVDLRVPRGRAPKIPEKAGRVSLAFIRTRPEVPPRGPQGGTLMFGGSGQVGALKVLRRTGRGGLGCDQAYWIP